MNIQRIIFLCFAVYFFNASITTGTWHLIDGANLFIHEGGHLIMSPFGKFLTIVGGSLVQVLVPCAVAYYFYRKDALFSSVVTLLWTGESIVNVGVYAYDGKDMVLPLVGGENTIHDWNYLLTSIGLIEHAHGVGVFIKLVGFLVLFFASYLAYMYFPSQRTEKKKDGTDTLQEDNNLDDSNGTVIVEGRYPFV